MMPYQLGTWLHRVSHMEKLNCMLIILIWMNLLMFHPHQRKKNDTTMHRTQKLGAEIELEERPHSSEGEYSEDTDDPDDPEYKKDTESEDSDDPDISDDNVSDEEYHVIKKNANKFKGNMCNSMIGPNRTVRLQMKGRFTFENTPDDPIEL